MGSGGSIQASIFVFNFPNLGDKFGTNMNLSRYFILFYFIHLEAFSSIMKIFHPSKVLFLFLF